MLKGIAKVLVALPVLAGSAVAPGVAEAAPARAAKENKGGPTRTAFRVPLSGVTVAVNGQSAQLGGVLSGVAQVNEDGAGGLHLKADVQSSALSVTLPSGAVLRGTGTAKVVANIGAPKGAASVVNAKAQVNLVGPNNTIYQLDLRLKLTVNANNQVTVAVVDAKLATA